MGVMKQGCKTFVLLQGQKKPGALIRGKLAMQVFSACMYGTVAISMNFVNKGAMREFPLSNVLLLNQMCLALIVLPSIKVPCTSFTDCSSHCYASLV